MIQMTDFGSANVACLILGIKILLTGLCVGVEMHKRSVRARSRPGQKNPDFFQTRSGRAFLKIGPGRAGLFQKYQARFSYKKPGFFKNPDFIRVFLKILGLFQALGPGRARPGFFRIGFFRFFSRSDQIGFQISDFLNISTRKYLKMLGGWIPEIYCVMSKYQLRYHLISENFNKEIYI